MILILAILTAFILVYSIMVGIYLAENSGVLESCIQIQEMAKTLSAK